MNTTETAKKTLFAAVGVGSTALDRAKELPERITSLPSTLTSRVTEFPGRVQDRVSSLRSNGSIRVTEFPKQAQKLSTETRKKATKAYKDFSKKGEKVVKQLQKSRTKKRKRPSTRTSRSTKAASPQAPSTPPVQHATSSSHTPTPEAATSATGQQSL